MPNPRTNVHTYHAEWFEIIERYQNGKPLHLGPYQLKKAKSIRMTFYRWRSRVFLAAREGDIVAMDLVNKLLAITAKVEPTAIEDQFYVVIEQSYLNEALEMMIQSERQQQ